MSKLGSDRIKKLTFLLNQTHNAMFSNQPLHDQAKVKGGMLYVTFGSLANNPLKYWCNKTFETNILETNSMELTSSKTTLISHLLSN